MVPRIPRKHPGRLRTGGFDEPGLLALMGTSTVVVFIGLGLGWWLYGNKSPHADQPDVLEAAAPPIWNALRDRLYVDEFYGATVIAFYGWWAKVADWLDRDIWGGAVAGVAWLFSWVRGSIVSSTPMCGWQLSTKAAKNSQWAEDCCRACRPAACRPTCGCWRWQLCCWRPF